MVDNSARREFQATGQITLTGQITATLRVNLAIQHLMAAARLSRQVGEVERKNAGAPFGEFFDEILGSSCACILMSVAAMEAYVNELFVDRAERFPDISSAALDALWNRAAKDSILVKYDLALILKRRPPLNRDRGSYKAVNLLIQLRNALTHFKPEWDYEQPNHEKLSNRLNNRFQASPFLKDTELLFPRRWAGHGSTCWAVDSVRKFLEKFEETAAVPRSVAKHRQSLEG